MLVLVLLPPASPPAVLTLAIEVDAVLVVVRSSSSARATAPSGDISNVLRSGRLHCRAAWARGGITSRGDPIDPIDKTVPRVGFGSLRTPRRAGSGNGQTGWARLRRAGGAERGEGPIAREATKLGVEAGGEDGADVAVADVVGVVGVGVGVSASWWCPVTQAAAVRYQRDQPDRGQCNKGGAFKNKLG